VQIREILKSASAALVRSGVDTPELDSALLLGHCLGKSRTELYLMASEELDSEIERKFLKLLQRRQQREPLAYILCVQEFWSLDFHVTPDVLIPRPETELLVERGIALWKDGGQSRGAILDLCTGSGIIAVVLAKELDRPVIAVDLSMRALQVARKNAELHGVSHLVSFVQSDLLTAFSSRPYFSLVLSNPPYVSIQDLQDGLQAEVDQYEPHLALDGGDRGLEIIRRIQQQLIPQLLPGANLLMEIGADQGTDLLSIFSPESAGSEIFEEVRVEKDYSNHDRIFHGKVKTS